MRFGLYQWLLKLCFQESKKFIKPDKKLHQSDVKTHSRRWGRAAAVDRAQDIPTSLPVDGAQDIPTSLPVEDVVMWGPSMQRGWVWCCVQEAVFDDTWENWPLIQTEYANASSLSPVFLTLELFPIFVNYLKRKIIHMYGNQSIVITKWNIFLKDAKENNHNYIYISVML